MNKPANPKVLIMAGGTGGHVYPALATALELRKRGWDVSWVGTQDKIESRVVPENNIDIDYLGIQGVRGKGIAGLVKAPFLILKSIASMISIIKKRRPDLVVGFGGFVSGPGGVASKLMSVPLVIQEQNAIAGTTNKLLSKIASKIATGFDGVFSDGVHLGNPVRSDIMQSAATVLDKPDINLLVMGGSLGAQVFNEWMPKVASELGCNIRHQTGEKQYQQTVAAYGSTRSSVQVVPFISDMNDAYSWADIILCRAGALTVSEIAVAGVPAIFVPLPHAIDDHQTANAQWLVSQDAAEMLRQSEITERTLVEKIESLKSLERRRSMSDALKRVAKPYATEALADLCDQVVNHG